MVLLLMCGATQVSADWSFGAYAGAAATQRAAVTLTRPAGAAPLRIPDVRFTGESFTPPIYYGYRVGHTLGRPQLWLEGELIHLKTIADASTLQAPVGHFEMSHGLNFVLASLAWTAAMREDSRFGWSMRAGAGPTVPHVEAMVDGTWREGYQPGGVGLQVAPGLSVRVWRGLHATAEYKWTLARVRVEVPGGEASAMLRSHHGAFGLSAIF